MDHIKPKPSLILTILSFLITFGIALGQERKSDVIVKRDSSRIEVKILIVADQSIQYKKISDPDGPVFHILKTDVAKITYGNGETETFANYVASSPSNSETPLIFYPINPWLQRDFTNNLNAWRPQELRSAYQFYNSKAKSTKIVALVFGALGTAATVTGIVLLASSKKYYSSYGYYYEDYNKKEIGRGLTIGGLITGATVGLIGGINSKNYRRKAEKVRGELLKRNESLTKISLQPGYNPFNKSASLSLILNF